MTIDLTNDSIFRLVELFELYDRPEYATELKQVQKTYTDKRDKLLSDMHSDYREKLDDLHTKIDTAFDEYVFAYEDLKKAFDYYTAKVSIMPPDELDAAIASDGGVK